MIPYDFLKTIPFLIGIAIGGLLVQLFSGSSLTHLVYMVATCVSFVVGWWARTSHVNRDYILLPKVEVEDDASS